MRRIYSVFIILFLSLQFCFCTGSGLSEILGEESARAELAFIAKLGPNSAILSWNCSTSAKGAMYTSDGLIPSLHSSKTHFLEWKHLTPNTSYRAVLTCGSQKVEEGSILEFTTWISNDPPKTRGIWILGGIGNDGLPVKEVDLFDPVTDTWYSSITNIPTPRIFASILHHKNKIYMIGGMENISGTYVSSSKVEVYDPYADLWETKASLPSGSIGAVAGSVGDEIYILSGSNSTDMTNGPVFNTILKFYPELGTNGQWISFSSASAIFSRVDMSGCAINGVIFYTGGRTYNSGSANSSTDGFAASANTTTSFSEPSLGESKHGAGGVCILPSSTDPFPADGVYFAVVGGSTGSGNVFQPATSIVPTNRTEFYQLGSGSFSLGPSLPASLYFPAVQTSYETRKIFSFGGASSINIPENTVYSLDSGNPLGSAWTTHGLTMPRRRYAHKAIRIDR
ncbi:Kelch repeat-containing protein [Leptospira sp. SA-E8]|uniref:Kelch repeat-containing protein n=1 Tax=Leptospira sp. SA-E8 TaxID=3422259 RepID=UPI003EBC4017